MKRLLFLTLLFSTMLYAQQTAPTQIKQGEPLYRLGANDAVTVQVDKHTELDLVAAVDPSNGKLQLPYGAGDIDALCLTVDQLKEKITEKYKIFLKNPIVTVKIRPAESNAVIVSGAVAKEMKFLLTRQVRILDLIQAAGGFTATAGDLIEVIPSENFIDCDNPQAKPNRTTEVLDRKMIEAGDVKVNRYARPGETIRVLSIRQ